MASIIQTGVRREMLNCYGLAVLRPNWMTTPRIKVLQLSLNWPRPHIRSAFDAADFVARYRLPRPIPLPAIIDALQITNRAFVREILHLAHCKAWWYVKEGVPAPPEVSVGVFPSVRLLGCTQNTVSVAEALADPRVVGVQSHRSTINAIVDLREVGNIPAGRMAARSYTTASRCPHSEVVRERFIDTITNPMSRWRRDLQGAVIPSEDTGGRGGFRYVPR